MIHRAVETIQLSLDGARLRLKAALLSGVLVVPREEHIPYPFDMRLRFPYALDI